jgi:hypothetical protein
VVAVVPGVPGLVSVRPPLLAERSGDESGCLGGFRCQTEVAENLASVGLVAKRAVVCWPSEVVGGGTPVGALGGEWVSATPLCVGALCGGSLWRG